MLHIYPMLGFYQIHHIVQNRVKIPMFERKKYNLLFTFATSGKELFLTFTGETKATKPVTILIFAFLPRWHLRRDIGYVQEGIALPLMRVMHTLSPPTPSSSNPRTDVILGESRFAAAVGRFHTPFMMMMMMMMMGGG